MKKIITASLVAMMAVTAANAEIASVEYLEAKTGDITTLTTTAKSNLTAAVNELNTGVQAAATKTALEQGLATKQDTIGDLATIRSGAAAGATALQQDAIAADGATVADADLDKVAPSITRMVNTINDLAGSGIQDVADDLGAYKTANDAKVNKNTQDIADINTGLAGKADKATTLAGYGITDAMTATQINGAIATATENMATTGDVATAKSEAIADAGTAADTKIENALKDYTNTAGMNSAISTAKTEAVAAAKTAGDAAYDAKGAAATAKSEAIEAAGTAADTKIETALQDYTNTTGMNSAISTAKTEAIAAAKEAADAAYDTKGAAAQALADAKADAAKYIDATELEQSQTAQNTALQGYADQAEADAIAAAKTAGDAAYQVKSSALSVGAAGGAWTDLTDVTGYSTTGTHSLVLKDGNIQWEAIRY